MTNRALIWAGEAATPLVDRLWGSLVESYGPAGPFYAIAAMGMMLALLAVPFLLKKNKDPLDRFSFRDERLKDDLVRLRTENDAGGGNLHGLGNLLEPTDKEELSQARRQLRAAGYKGGGAVRLYYLARAGLGIGLLLFGLMLFVLIPEEPRLVMGLAFSGIMALAGYFFPVYWVKRQIESRRQKIQDSFPDCMDMMLVCIEGGHSLDQAMARVGMEMQTTGSPLAEEMQIVTHEFRAGKDRASVLRDFADRCAVNDISSFVTVLIQSSTFGTSISQALRVYAAEMRDKRLMRAEEKANVLPTKLTLGTMAFTVPPLILILAGPSFIQIVRSLTQFGAGP
jgi:tight adherence protein C